MPYPWANVLLLFLLAAELASGLLGLVSGTENRAVYLHLHRIGGFAILAIFLWKGRNVWRSLARRIARGRGGRGRRPASVPGASLLLMALLVASLALGLGWSHLGAFSFQGVSGVSWHIYASLLLGPVLLWHSINHRWTFRPALWAERRSFLRLGGLALAGLALWRMGEFGAGALGLPGSDRRFTGSYQAASFSGNAFPTTSWINDKPDRIDAKEWSLRVMGHVVKEVTLSYDELYAFDAKVTATLDCTGGWYSTQEWQGAPLWSVLERAGPLPTAASVTVRSVTGYTRRFSMDEARELLLATRVGDEPISHGHGFPLRLVAPGRRGYQWVKWVTTLEVNDTGKWLQSPLPLQ